MSWFGKANALDKGQPAASQVTAWLAALDALAGMTGPIREQDLMPVATALQQQGGLTSPEASAIASWLGGYANSTDFLSNAFQLGDPDVYMDVESLVDSTNGPRLVIGDVLRKLRDDNAAAHAWVIDRANAKHDKKAADSDADLFQHRMAVVNKEIDLATKAAETAVELPAGFLSGLKSLIDGAAKALANPWVTIGVAVVVVLVLGAVFLVLRSRLERLVS